MSGENAHEFDLNLKELLQEKPPGYLIPKFALLPLVSLPNHDILELKRDISLDFDILKSCGSDERVDLSKNETCDWTHINERLVLSEEDQQEIHDLLASIDNAKINLQRFSAVKSKEKDSKKEESEFEFEHLKGLSETAKLVLTSENLHSAILPPLLNSKLTRRKRKLEDTEGNLDESDVVKIKIKVDRSRYLSAELKFSTINFAGLNDFSNDDIQQLLSSFDKILTVLATNDFENKDVWFKHFVISNNHSEESYETIYGVEANFLKTIDFFVEKLHHVFNNGLAPFDSKIWPQFYTLLEHLSLNLALNEDTINDGRLLKLQTIKLIFDIYKFSLYKMQAEQNQNHPFHCVKPFKFDIMEACLSLLSEYSQDIFEKDFSQNGDESSLTFFNGFSLKELKEFYDCLGKLNVFLGKKPVLDSWSINKIILSVQHIILLGGNVNKYATAPNSAKLVTVNLIRKATTNIFTEIFQSYPVQRDLILDLVLSSFNAISTTRNNKMLIRVTSYTALRHSLDLNLTTGTEPLDVEEFHVSYFTFNLVSLIQCLTFASDFAVDKYKENIPDLFALSESLQKELLSWSVLATDSIFQKLQESFSTCRHSLEIYCKDLVTLFRLPEWNVSEYLLASVTNKLLELLSMDKRNDMGIDKLKDEGEDDNTQDDAAENANDFLDNTNSNIENLALQVLAPIGSTMLELSHSSFLKPGLYSLKNITEDSNILLSVFTYLRELRALLSKKQNDKLANHYIVKTLSLLDDLKQFIEVNKKEQDSVHFQHLLKYIDSEALELIHKDVKNIKLDGFYKTDSGEQSYENYASLTFDQFLQTSTVMKFYEPYLAVILSSLGSKKAKIRAGALKNFSALISKDTQIVNLPFVKNTVNKMLTDSSPMVKCNILTLLQLSPNLTSYIDNINLNFNDSSLAVRKHVFLLNQRMFEDSADFAIWSKALHYILRKLEDEDIKLEEEAFKYIYEIIFVNLHKLNGDLVAQDEYCEKIITTLISVISGSEKVHQLFKDFFNLVTARQQSRYNKKQNKLEIDLSAITIALNIITKKLIINIVNSQQEERYNDFSEYLVLLEIIASCNSKSFITREDLVILYPFLNMDAETKDEKVVRLSILQIFDFCFKKEKLGFRSKLLSDIEIFLLENITKFSLNETDTVVSILFNIARNRKEYQNLILTSNSLVTTFEPYLNKLKYQNKNQKSVQLNGNIKLVKLLVLLTSFAVHSQNRPKDFTVSSSGLSLFKYVVKVLILIVRNQRASQDLLKTAFYQLGILCNSNPVLYTSSLVFDTIVDIENAVHGVSAAVKVQFVKNMINYLREQELKPTQITEEITLSLLTKITPLVLPLMTLNNEEPEDEKISILKTMIEFMKMLQYVKFLNPQVYLGHCIPLLGCSSTTIRLSMIRFFITLDYDLYKNTTTSNNAILEKGLRLSLDSFMDQNVKSATEINVQMLKLGLCLIDKKIFSPAKVVKVFLKLMKEDAVLFSRNLRSNFKSSCFICMNVLMLLNYFDKVLIEDFLKLAQLNLESFDESLAKFRAENKDDIVLYNGILSFNIYKVFLESLEQKLQDYDNVSFQITDFNWQNISFQGPIDDVQFVIDKYYK